jgi:hypothetical protein
VGIYDPPECSTEVYSEDSTGEFLRPATGRNNGASVKAAFLS